VFARQADGTVPPAGSTPADRAAREAFETLAAQAPDRVSVERADPDLAVRWRPPSPDVKELVAAKFERTLDWRWRRTSYSDMTAGAHEVWVGSEPEEPAVRDEPNLPAPVTTDEAPDGLGPETPSRLGALPVGVRAGTLVHEAFEASDFAAPDLEGELARALEAVPSRRSVTLADVEAVVGGLRAALETPLGPILGDRALRDVARADRLDELGFELPLAGGEVPNAAVTVQAIAAALRSELAAHDPLRAYADHLDDPTLRQTVRGYLTGSLDLVVRLPGARFAIVDYKTNWLAEPDEPLTAWHYRPASLRTEMYQRHYGLQAMLYAVALHRYLRWRLPGYSPERNLAGVLYLFVRGMTGPQTPVIDGDRCGVFAWPAAPTLVTRLSDVLDGGTL
jgi:exodeoxyribonuclease V beta subunit